MRLAPKALSHAKPGASPQESESQCKQALKARFNPDAELNRAFSAGALFISQILWRCPRLVMRPRKRGKKFSKNLLGFR